MDSSPPRRSRRITYHGKRLALYEATAEARAGTVGFDVLGAEAAADEALRWLSAQRDAVRDDAELDRAWASIRRW